MNMDDLSNCNICMETYDDNVRPRVLNCGHSFCTSCLNNFIAGRTLACPHCQQAHFVSSANNLPINYALEQIISILRETQLTVAPSHQSGAIDNKRQSTIQKEKPKDQNSSLHSRTMSGKIFSLIKEQKDSTQNLTRESKEMQSHLHQYKDFLLERKAKHEDLFQKTIALANRNKEIAEKINTEYEKVAKTQKEGKALEDVMNVKLEILSAVTTTQDSLAAIDEHDKSFVALEEWNKNCQKQLPNPKTISCSEKVMRETTAALSMVIREDEAASEPLNLSESSLSIMDKLGMIRGETPLTLTCLQSMSTSVKNFVEKNLLYAVQNQDGHIRSAKVTVKDSKTYLHYLQDGEPPARAQTIKQSDLIGTLESDAVVAFMDLAWEGSIQGRIHILLSPGTPLGRHFRTLCSGDLGPSYAHSRFLNVWYKGNTIDERVVGGDYEHNNGSGGAPLIRGINVTEEIYTRTSAAGIVWASHDESNGPKIAKFSILTGTGGPIHFVRVFGEVQEGLDVVRAAANLDDIGSVTIADCGVVLPF